MGHEPEEVGKFDRVNAQMHLLGVLAPAQHILFGVVRGLLSSVRRPTFSATPSLIK